MPLKGAHDAFDLSSILSLQPGDIFLNRTLRSPRAFKVVAILAM
jgi:hypothetical protein